jgi:nucleotide-binding universal stress UspA family protein
MPSLLIGLDPSPDAGLALSLSLSWARQAGWGLTGLGIVSEVLDQFGRRCAAAGVSSEGRVASGVPAEQILLEAERHDLIVLGRESHFHFETQESADKTVRLVLQAMPRPVVLFGSVTANMLEDAGRPLFLYH